MYKGAPYLFGDGSRKVLVGIRQRPTDAEIKEAFGSASYDAEYAMDGSTATPGSNGGGIIYLVSGFVPEEETPVPPEPPSEPDPTTPTDGGSDRGGCNGGWGMICLTALAAMFLGRRQ